MKPSKAHFLVISLLLFGCNQADISREASKNVIHPSKILKSDVIDTVTQYGPNSMVRNVKQGSKGTVLFAASRSGVFRYDGKTFTNIASKIGPRRYWDVLEDRKGAYWLASTDSGVYRYDGQSVQHFTTKEGLADNRVMRIYEDKAGLIWFGTGSGVSRYDGQSFQNFTTKDGLSNNDITTIIEDRTGKIWFGTRGDACFYDGKKFTVLRNNDGKAFHNTWAIIEDRKGNIWFDGSIVRDRKSSTLFLESGLWRYDGSTVTKVSSRGASDIIEDREGNIWTTGNVNPPTGQVWALSRYDQKSLYNKEPALTEIMSTEKNMLCRMLEAADGSIWFGSMKGVYRYDGKTVTDFKKTVRN